MLMNLSALLIFFPYLPFLGILGPLIMWKMKGNTIAGIAETARRILNFQITWTLMFFAMYYSFFRNLLGVIIHHHTEAVSPVIQIIGMGRIWYTGMVAGMPVNFLLILLMLLYVAILIIINTVRASRGKQVWYRPCVRLLREI